MFILFGFLMLFIDCCYFVFGMENSVLAHSKFDNHKLLMELYLFNLFFHDFGCLLNLVYFCF